MIELRTLIKRSLVALFNDAYFVSVLFDEGAEGELELAGGDGSVGPGQTENVPGLGCVSGGGGGIMDINETGGGRWYEH